MDKTHPLAQHIDRFSFIAIAFFMSYTYSFDYEIMQLPDTEGILYVLSNVTTYLGDIKMLYKYLQGVCWVGIDRDQDLSLRVSERYLWAVSVMHITISLASNVNNELVAG